MEKRYQVFVSSTYADLQEERDAVFQTLMKMDCIPAGMELFPAIDEEQFEFIKRVIDDCDYYILIIGGRYGSLTPEGISYTKKEYDYAIQRGIRVIAFLHENPNEIAVGKSDVDHTLREKLLEFRNEVSRGRLVNFWKSASELPGLVALSLLQTMKAYPAVGWVRSSKMPSNDLLIENHYLKSRNDELMVEIDKLRDRYSVAHQRFEDSFFQLLKLQRDSMQSLRITQPNGQEWEGSRAFRRAVHILESYFKDDGLVPMDEYELFSFVVFGFNATCASDGSDFGHYFRTLYHLIEFIDQSFIDEKAYYVGIVRAQLSTDELTLLFYNGLSEQGENFKPLIEKYALLKNWRMHDPFQVHRDRYRPEAYGE
jgi:hypothetical protein